MTRTVPEAGPSQGFFAKSGLEMIRVLAVLGLLVVLGIYAQPRLLDIWLGLPFVVAGGWLRAWPPSGARGMKPRILEVRTKILKKNDEVAGSATAPRNPG